MAATLLTFPTLARTADVGKENPVLARKLDRKVAAVITKYRASIPRMMAEQKVPGLAIAVLFRNKLVWAQGFGVTGGPSSPPVTPGTMFSVQSISKTYTATAVMAAVGEGKVSLDEPVTTYLPGFTVNSRFEADPQKKITLRLLLSHHAGLTHQAPVGNNYDDDTRAFDAHIESISGTWLKFPVGQRHIYSNLGIDLAGHVLEAVYQLPFDQVMSQKVFDPLGLVDTTVNQDEIENLTTRAIGHTAAHDRVPVRIAMIPAGGVYTNVLDMARFMQFHMNGGKAGKNTVVSRGLLATMYAPCCSAADSSYGLGIGEAKTRFGKTTVISRGHGGGGLGFMSDMYWFSELGVGIAILTNSDNHQLQGALYSALSREIFEVFLGQNVAASDGPGQRPPVSIDESRRKQLAGVYVGSRDFELVLQGSQLGRNYQSNFYPAKFFSPDEMLVKLPEMKQACRFHADGQRDPAWAYCTVEVGSMRIAGSLDHNGSPYDPAGPDKPEWRVYLGDYDVPQWGKVIHTIRLYVDNGYLFFGRYRVVDEFKPGLFFLSNGEALDLRGPVPTHGNVAMIRRASHP